MQNKIVMPLEKFEDFRNRVMHPQAPSFQIEAMRQAFMAGAVYMFDVVAFDMPALSDEEGCKFLSELHLYFKMYIEAVKAGAYEQDSRNFN